MKPILIVGGGIAGLQAANILHQNNTDFILFEKQGSLGGRVSSTNKDGFILDRGFQVLQSSYPKRGNYEYIKERVEYTFYDPKTASKELVDEVFEITNSIPKVMRIIAIAKSAQRNNMAKDIVHIKAPTLLIWGLNDTITPPEVGHEFNQLIQGSTLRFIDKCCHAPMMERPTEFNEILTEWLNQNPV